MSLPPLLLVELRLAFRTCAKHYPQRNGRCLSTALRLYNKAPSLPTKAGRVPSTSATPRHPSNSTRTGESSKLSDRSDVGKNLVPRETQPRSLDSERRSNIPLRVLPKAELTPDVKLSPRQRLHIEMLTRRTPQPAQRKMYREKLLIYYCGNLRESALIWLKFATLFGAVLIVSGIVVPAHYFAGTPLPMVALYFVLGWVPVIAIHAATKGHLSRVYLHLPLKARESPQTAMEYAKNLPANALLDLEFHRLIPHRGKVTANLADLIPSHKTWPPTTFKWTGHRADPGTFWWPNPTEFWAGPRSTTGKGARYTVPGLWSTVYRRLAGIESQATTRWKM